MIGVRPREPIYNGFGGTLAKAVDSFVGLFAPGLAHGMQKRRIQSSALLAFEAAKVDRMMPKESLASADGEVLDSLPTMRARSRRHERDDGHIAGAVSVYVDAVVGDGIKPQCATTTKETGRGETVIRKWREACQNYFEDWSANMADSTREGSFYDLQALVARTRKIDGECFTHSVVGNGIMAIEVIDSDRVANPNMKKDTPNLRSGVEIDSKGMAVGYHIAEMHPDDADFGATVPYTRVSPWDGDLSVVQHCKRKGRAGQTRGIPDGASSAQYLEHLHHYLKSEIVGARAAANYAMFIKKSVSATDADIIPVDVSSEGGLDQEYHENLEAGTIAYLNEGEEPFAFNPNRPGAGDAFVIRILRAVSASHGMSYERMCRNWGGMNYTSMRGQLKEEERGFNRDRGLMNRQFNTPWWRNVIRHGIQTGKLVPPPSYLDNPEPWLKVIWIAPPQGMVDPTKEIAASTAAIEANLSTPWHEAGRSGLDPEEILERKAAFLARAAELEAQYKLAPGSLTGGAAASNEKQGAAGGQKNDEDEDDAAAPSDSKDEDDEDDTDDSKPTGDDKDEDDK
tara:strand:+ start:5623 stop:7329 length:1707 start_codon:yes stop_codon:yes gene_type:complete